MENSRTDLIRAGRGRWRTAAFLAFALLACMKNAPSGDILRGGATSSGAPTGAGAGGPTAGAAAAAAAKDKATDRLARTTQAITSVRAMQNAAAAAAAARPNVPNGLQTGGLVVATGANANWTGARAPQQQGSTIYIKQKEPEAVLHWETFNIGAGTTVRYDQSAGGSDSGDWIAFNKVFDPSGKPSQILGKIQAEGQVYIVNQNGIVFGAGSQVNTRTLVASSLPVNDNLIELGLLNNGDAQFLFSALTVPGGTDGTPDFVPPAPVNGVIGDVVVEAGALIESPVNADGNGGRVMLVGPNVRNDGIISTPKGQTILAAGLQVGVAAHDSEDPSLRGLDIWIGSVGSYDGAATNNGLLESLQGSVIMAGKAVNQMGVVNSSTDVDLNGRIDLLASYGAVGNPGFDKDSGSSKAPPFLNQYTGVVTLGENSVTMVLPNYASTKTIPGSLTESSQITILGGTVNLRANSVVMAPSGDILVRAGTWPYVDKDGNRTTLNANGGDEAGLQSFYEGSTQKFLLSSGQIFMEPGALVDASGTTDVFVALAQNLVTVQLRGFELADMPIQQDGEIRGISLVVDLRMTGEYGGETWYGTPLGDLSGVVDTIQRNISQLTVAGGTVTMEAGDAIIFQPGSTVDVSGGYSRYEGGFVQTSRLVRGPNIIAIEDATPNVLYDGVYTGKTEVVSEKWGVTKSYSHPLAPMGGYPQQEYVQGAAGGTINLNAPTLLLGGELMGNVIQGPRQQDSPPELASLNLSFTAQKMVEKSATEFVFLTYSPFAPLVTVTNEQVAATFTQPAKDGAWPVSINPELRQEFQLSTSLYTEGGFGHISIENKDGDFILPAGTVVRPPPGGGLTVEARNVLIEGSVIAPGGEISFTAYNYSPYLYAEQSALGQLSGLPLPLPDPTRGIITVSAGSVLSTAGLFIDERPKTATEFGSPHVLNGGSIVLEGYTINLEEGSVLDVSGGVLAKATGGFSSGNGGDIAILAGRDPSLTDLIGGELHLNAELLGYSVKTGGSLSIQAQLIQIGGGASSDGRLFAVEPEFFQQGGFSGYSLTGIGARDEATGLYTAAVRVVAGTTIQPMTESWIITPYQSPNGQLGVTPYLKPVGLRPPASIALNGLGADDGFTTDYVEAIGLVVLEEGTKILTDPGARVEVKGEAVAVLGEIRAPGGTIVVTGGDEYPLPQDTEALATTALPTVYIGPSAVLSAAGTVVMLPDPYGRSSGYVLPGGSILVSGNIIAETGAILDVSGASAVLDFHPTRLANGPQSVPLNAGLNSTPWELRTVPVQVDSNGGLIMLRGGQMMYSNATLLGEAGGPTALGGTLAVSSGRFYPAGTFQTSADINLIVEQSGNGLEFGDTARFGDVVGLMSGERGYAAAFDPNVTNGGIGYFAIDQFSAGGFDSLDLGYDYRETGGPIPFGGNVEFRGPIVIDARGSVRIAGGGVVMADSPVSITAGYIAIGQEFRPPAGPDDPFVPFKSFDGQTTANYHFAPTSGPGTLALNAGLIDIGTLSLQGISQADLTAGGDIRGNGTVEIAGDLTLTAAQVYPTTLAAFNIFAFDSNILVAESSLSSPLVTLASAVLPPGFGIGSPLLGSTVTAIDGKIVTLAANANTAVSPTQMPVAFVYDPGSGSVTIVQNGIAETPMSVGGSLSIYASTITQDGTLRAPLGSITLGWDGTDLDPTDADLDTPVSPISGSIMSVPVANSVLLSHGSVTSVSALDLAGTPMLIPYGLSTDGLTWLDPAGTNVTTSGLPEKSVSIAGNKVTMQAGATIDIRGGGDLLAFRWVEGLGGSVDILGTAVTAWGGGSYESGDLVSYNGNTWSARVDIDPNKIGSSPVPGSNTRYWTLVPESYAVVPGFGSSFAPYNPFNPTAGSLDGDPGYVSPTLGLGDQIYLDAGSGLAAGYYTLLPRRYAILPGAFLITPQDGPSVSTELGQLRPYDTADGATYVTGYRFNAFNSPAEVSPVRALYEVAPPEVVVSRAEYELFSANTFMPEAAARLDLDQTQPLPNDSGYLSFSGNLGLKLEGAVLTAPGSPNGRGATIDIASFQDIYIVGGSGDAPPGSTVVLNTAILNSWGAESLLIGGLRYEDNDGVHVDVRAPSITLDNPGSVLEGSDITLVANRSLVVTEGSAIFSTRTGSQPVDTFLIEGDGALLRVGSNPGSSILRSNVTLDPSVSMQIGAGSQISGMSVILDSTFATSLDPTATIDATALQLGSGQISIVLEESAGGLTGSIIDPHLVLQGNLLADVQNSKQLTLLSYTTIDVYGAGSFGNEGMRSLSFLSSGIRGYEQNGGTALFTADRVEFGNPVNIAVVGPVPPLDGTLQFDASTIRFGDNDFAVTGFHNLVMNAAGGVLAVGEGSFSTAGNLSIFAPLITGSGGSKTEIVAAGDLVLETVEGKAKIKSGLGATISFSGNSIVANTRIVLPSGLISLEAANGITVGGELNVEGSAQKFYDLVQYADAGNIVLESTSGDVTLLEGSIVSVAADAAGGDAGTLAVIVPQGDFLTGGELRGQAAEGYHGASLILDVGELPVLSTVLSPFTTAGFNETMAIRVRTNDVLIDGVTTAHDFSLAADGGGILVQGTIDASGLTGGSIALTARDSLTLAPTAILTVAGEEFSSAGKGGSVRLEGGATVNGISNALAMVDIQAGSLIDLSVAEYADYTAVDHSLGALPDYQQVGTAAFYGLFQGTLHVRAPQTAAADNLQVAPIAGTINGASNILIEGYRIWDLTLTGGQITNTGASQASGGVVASPLVNVQQSVFDNGVIFGTNAAAIEAALLTGGNAALADITVVTAGAEIINQTGDLTLGTPTSLANADWNLSGYRYGADMAPGILTLRAAGDLVFNNTLSDGFTPVANTATNGNSTMWLAPLMAINPLLPTNLQSWSYNLTAGADLSSVDHGAVLSAANLAPGEGSVLVGEFYDAVPNPDAVDSTGLTSNSIRISTTGVDQGTRYEVIRTGTGDIDIHAGLDVQLRNQFATIYTAGAAIPTSAVTSIYSPGDFVIPSVTQGFATHPPQSSLGSPQQIYAPQWSLAGGDVSLSAQGDIWHSTMLNGEIIVDSTRQMPNNWLYRRGYVDPATGEFGVGGVDSSPAVVDAAASTTWWIDFSNFFEGVGALGGGNVTLEADGDVINVDALAATNARMPGRVQNPDLTFSNIEPDADKLLELGGGDVVVRAGGDISGGVYYVERGQGTLTAGGSITTNAARSPSLGILDQSGTPAVLDPLTWMPTTLFVGKSSFHVQAQGDVLLGPVVNTFLMPQGLNNKFWYKTYFNTFSEDAGVDVVSVGGNITHRLAVSLPSVVAAGATAPTQSVLSAWYSSQYSLDAAASAYYQPWLRLSDPNLAFFETMFTVNAPNLSSTAFGGDINIVGTMNLFPSPTGNIELAAAGSIVGLNPSGKVYTILGDELTAWTSSLINLSDAAPSAVPGVASPLAYQAVVGRSPFAQLGAVTDPFEGINQLFLETGSYTGAAAAVEVKQALHDQGILHSEDTEPVRIYAGTGNVTGFTLFTPKFTQVVAGNDITDVSLYIQNVDDRDISIVSAGRDIVPYNENAPIRSEASDFQAGNVSASGALVGDIQISGPGTLEVIAGRNIDLGTGPNLGDGTGTGITSIGRARNPALDIEGADLVVVAGVKGADGGAALGLANSTLDIEGFVDAYGLGEVGSKNMTDEEEALAALNVLFGVLQTAASTQEYDPAFAALGTLFGSGVYEGDIFTQSRDIRTASGGSITMLAPGGKVKMADDIIGNPLTPPGIVTEFGGEVMIMAEGDIDIGANRIFTLRGGDLTLWSSQANIAAGTAAKTVVTAPPTRVVIDANSADVQTDLGGLATGGGIGVLAAVENVEPGQVYLGAPNGSVDAGDAGIRATGDIVIGSPVVLNADNIAAGGKTSGVPTAPPPAAPNIAGMTSAANSTGATSNAAQEMASESQQQAEEEEESSIFTVEVLGYGGDENDG